MLLKERECNQKTNKQKHGVGLWKRRNQEEGKKELMFEVYQYTYARVHMERA
jgi:hypothetical protein